MERKRSDLVGLGPAVNVVAIELTAGFTVLAPVIDEDPGAEMKLVADGVWFAEFLIVVVVIHAHVVAIGLLLVFPGSVELCPALVTVEPVVGVVPFALGILELEEGLLLWVFLNGALESEKGSHELVVGLALAVTVSRASERQLGVFVEEVRGGNYELVDTGRSGRFFGSILGHGVSLEAKGGEDGNDGDNDEKFDERESGPLLGGIGSNLHCVGVF